MGTGLTSYEFYGTGLKGVIVTPLIALSRGPNLQPNLRQGCLGPRRTRNLHATYVKGTPAEARASSGHVS